MTADADPAAAAQLAAALQQIRSGFVAAGCARVASLATQDTLAGRNAAAEAALRAALELAPRSAVLLARLAGIQQLEGHAAAAEELSRRALAHDAGEPMAAALLIDALLARAECGEAIAIGEACLARAPAAAHVRRALSGAYLFAGRARDAFLGAKRAAEQLRENPTALSSACVSSLYDDRLQAPELAAVHHVFGARMPAEPARATLAPRAPLAGRALRVGFVSADLAAHPVGLFIEPVLRELDRSRFEPYVYARVKHPDAITHRLKSLPLAWRDTDAMSDAQVHAAIQSDRIDVLLDLSGHTWGGRPRLFAARAAPVQVAYLGYPYASGIRAIDYLIADATVLPRPSEPLYGEKPLRLPGCFLCMQPASDAPEVAPSPALLRGTLTFGSLNHLAKLSDRTVALWSEVLAAVPDSRLLLCALGLGDHATRVATHARFAVHGIEARRVALLPPRPVLSEFLTYYDGIDIGLDPLPFNGGTTTLQALWQGVPTITLPGRTLQNRMGVSILREAGLTQFVARDGADYVAIARRWNEHVAELARLREGMRARLSRTTLLDAPRFARGFEDALERAARGTP